MEEVDGDFDALPPLTVPLVNADAAAIEYLQSSEAVKNLGLFACPDGSTKVRLTRMQDKVEDWTKLVKKWVPNDKMTVDKLHALTVGRPKIRYVSIFNATTPPSTGPGILRLLPH